VGNGKIMVEENKYLRTLTENAQQGKVVALEELYELNLNQVHTLVSRLAGNKLIAEELTKTILVRAWERISEDGPGKMMFSDWIRELSVHITVDELRDPTFINNKKFKKHLKKNIHNANYSSDLQEKIVAELDLEHRIVFVLNKIENYTVYEVSNFMGMNPTETETKLSESTEQITQALSDTDTKVDLRVNWVNLQAVIEPDGDILKSVFEEIKEVRTAEIKEEEAEFEAERQEEIKELEKAIEKERKEKAKAAKVKRNWGDFLPSLNFNRKAVIGVAIVLVIFLIVNITSSSSDWPVSISSGTPFINEKPVEISGGLAIEDVITTDELSSAVIGIPEIGLVNISKNTKLTRIEPDLTLGMVGGRIYIEADNAIAKLNLKIPDAIVRELKPGTSYSVRVDDRKNSEIILEKGWLRVYAGDEEIVFPERYILNVYSNSGANVPYHITSSVEYIALLDEYLFGGKRDKALNKILSASTKNESISLWNLLSRVDVGHQVQNVYYKLLDIAPHSEKVTKADIMLLEPDALNTWLEEIKWQL
jgi:DNA-directed RNA polymerase specialized sigma24 family protein